MDLHAKARTVESWGLQEEQKGCPMSETTRSCQLCETPLQGIAEPLAMARSLSENMSKKREKILHRQRMKEQKQRETADGTPGSEEKEEILHSGACIHTAAPWRTQHFSK